MQGSKRLEPTEEESSHHLNSKSIAISRVSNVILQLHILRSRTELKKKKNAARDDTKHLKTHGRPKLLMGGSGKACNLSH